MIEPGVLSPVLPPGFVGPGYRAGYFQNHIETLVFQNIDHIFPNSPIATADAVIGLKKPLRDEQLVAMDTFMMGMCAHGV